MARMNRLTVTEWGHSQIVCLSWTQEVLEGLKDTNMSICLGVSRRCSNLPTFTSFSLWLILASNHVCVCVTRLLPYGSWRFPGGFLHTFQGIPAMLTTHTVWAYRSPYEHKIHIFWTVCSKSPPLQHKITRVLPGTLVKTFYKANFRSLVPSKQLLWLLFLWVQQYLHNAVYAALLL